MYPYFLIAKNNLKKKKGDVAVLFCLITVAALLIYGSTSILAGLDDNVTDAYERAHTPDYLFVADVDEMDRAEELLKSQPEVTEFDKCQAVFTETEYRGSLDEEKSTYSFKLEVMEDARSIGRLVGDGIDELLGHGAQEDAILLPYSLRSSYRKGDSFYLTLDKKEYRFTVAGFNEDPLIATPMNVTLNCVFITRQRMDEILREASSLRSGLVLKVRLAEGTDTTAFDERMDGLFAKEIPSLGDPDTFYMGVNWNTMKSATAILPYLVMGLILVFSILLIGIALIIVRFSVRNFMENNLKNIGILQACGYTAKQLQAVCVVEMGLIALLGIAAGIALGALGGGVIGDIEGMLSGISWRQPVSVGAALFTAACVMAVITGTAAAVGRLYAQVSVLEALRGGIHAHNFRKNYFPLDKSRLPLGLALSGKRMMGEKGKSLSVSGIVFLLALVTCSAFALYECFGVREDFLLDLVGMESAEAGLTGLGSPELEQMRDEIDGWKETDTVLAYSNINVKLSHGDAERTVATDVWDNCELVRHEVLVEGRRPKYDNEIVITSVLADELGVSLGESIYAEGEGERKAYVVVGIDQKINRMGITAMMTPEGAARLNGRCDFFSLYVYLEGGYGFEAFRDRIGEAYPDVQVVDTRAEISQTIESVKSIILLLCVVFVTVSCLIVLMVEILLVRTRLAAERKRYGISKALGYTAGQLMYQTMMENLPLVAGGAVLGVAASRFLIGPFVRGIFGAAGIGLKTLEIETPPVYMLVTAAGLILVAAAAAMLASVRIRSIEPTALLTEE